MNTTLKRIGAILLASGVAAVVSNSVHPRKIPWVQDWSRQVEAKAAKQQLNVIPLSVALRKHQLSETVIFVDARSAAEFSAGHIAGAVSIPLNELDIHFDVLLPLIESGRELVIYCSNRACDDSLLLATELQAMGADNLALYIDGYDLWIQHDGAVETGP